MRDLRAVGGGTAIACSAITCSAVQGGVAVIPMCGSQFHFQLFTVWAPGRAEGLLQRVGRAEFIEYAMGADESVNINALLLCI